MNKSLTEIVKEKFSEIALSTAVLGLAFAAAIPIVGAIYTYMTTKNHNQEERVLKTWTDSSGRYELVEYQNFLTGHRPGKFPPGVIYQLATKDTILKYYEPDWERGGEKFRIINRGQYKNQ